MNEDAANLVTLNCPACAQEISVPVSGGASAFACPLCGEGFQVDGAGAPGGEGPAPTPIPASAPSPAPKHKRTEKWSAAAVSLVTIVIVVAVVGIAGYVASQMPTSDSKPQVGQDEWPVATLSGHTIDGVTVRVQSVEVGPVRARNANGTAFVSDREDYWIVRLRIRNGKATPIMYRTWHAAEFSGASLSGAVLRDDDGNAFVMQQFEDVAELQGQTIKKTLAPRESTLDVIVFDAPEGFNREQLQELRLELPGAACEVQGSFRQVIPKSLVE